MTAEPGRSRRSADTHEARERSRNVAQPKPGPQFMVRLQTGEKISGRPDQEEQQRLAETIGARLRELRLDYGLSVRDLERRSGVNRSTISRLERGLRRPRMSVLGWLAWGLTAPDNAEPVKQDLISVAGDLVIAESRWSERSHARRAWRQLRPAASSCRTSSPHRTSSASSAASCRARWTNCARRRKPPAPGRCPGPST